MKLVVNGNLMITSRMQVGDLVMALAMVAIISIPHLNDIMKMIA
jgi:hypothetical protein